MVTSDQDLPCTSPHALRWINTGKDILDQNLTVFKLRQRLFPLVTGQWKNVTQNVISHYQLKVVVSQVALGAALEDQLLEVSHFSISGLNREMSK